MEHLRQLRRQTDEIEAEIKHWHEQNEASRRLADVPGIGVLTASALVASIGDAKAFSSGRQLAAWLGLVPGLTVTGSLGVLICAKQQGAENQNTARNREDAAAWDLVEQGAGGRMPENRG